jgi:signal transduction histidine kinase
MRLYFQKNAVVLRLCICALAMWLPAAAQQAGGPVLDAPDSRAQAGGSASAVLAFARTGDGGMVVGRAESVSVFDGVRWADVPVPAGAHSFRSLAATRDGDAGADRSRVYVGGVGSVGFIEQDASSGAWKHVSLLAQLRASGPAVSERPGEVWHAHAEKDGAVFVTDHHVLRWNASGGHGGGGHGGGDGSGGGGSDGGGGGGSGGSGYFETWNLKSDYRLHAFSVRGGLVIQQSGAGLLRLERDGPRLWIPEAGLPAKSPLVALVELEPAGAGGADDANGASGASGANGVDGVDGASGAAREVFVFGDRVFVRDNNAWTEWRALADLLKDRYAVGACATGGGRLAVGLFLGGVAVVGGDGRVRAVANEANGLPDDNVHALWSDGAGTVWIGAASGMMRWRDAGIASLHALPEQAGTVRRLVAFDGGVSLLTTRGMYSIGKNGLERVARAPGLWWDSADIGGTSWMSGFGGVWRWDALEKRLVIEHNVSADVFCLGDVGAADGGFVFVENEAIKIFTRGQWGWVPRETGLKLDSAPVSMATEDVWTARDVSPAEGRWERRFWISTLGGNVWVLAWDSARMHMRVLFRMRAGAGLPPGATRPRIVRSTGRIVLFCDAGIFAQTGGHALSFAAIAALRDFAGVAVAGAGVGASAGAGVSAGGNADFWVVRRRGGNAQWPDALVRITRDGDAWSWTPLEISGLDRISPAVAAFLESEGGGEAGGGGGADQSDLSDQSDGTAGASGAARADSAKTLLIAGQGGVLRVHVADAPAALAPPALSVLREVGGMREIGEAREMPDARDALDALAARRTFYFPATQNAAAGRRLFYETKLGSVETVWSMAPDSAERGVSGLAPADYVFAARVADRFGRNGGEIKIAFVTPPPWYQTWPAFIVYAVCGAAAVAGLVRWRLRRLRRQNERLNALVDERTRELSLSNTARSEFLDNISHEIRNPLEGIVGLVALMDADATRERTMELARSLKACAQNLEQVFNDMLDISKIEYGRVPLENRTFRLRGLLGELRGLFLAKSIRQGNTLEVTCDDDGAGEWDDCFNGDAGKIKTIIGNFISNALKYAPGTRVTISAEELEGAGDYAELIIEVADEGPGVPPAEQGLIFRKFVRGAKAREAKAGGAGIGLAVCHALARALGGGVGVESPVRDGRGASFFLQVKLKRADGRQDGGRVGGQDGDRAGGQDGDGASDGAGDGASDGDDASDGDGAVVSTGHPRHARLAGKGVALIVDDQPYNQVALAGLAELCGFVAVCASSGEAALAQAAKQWPALVLLDLGLPDMSGADVARELRARQNGNAPVIIGLSAHKRAGASEGEGMSVGVGKDAGEGEDAGEDGDAGEGGDARARKSRACESGACESGACESGMDAFVLKPLTRETLLAVISNAGISPRGTGGKAQRAEGKATIESQGRPELSAPDLSALELHARKNACSLEEAARVWCDQLRGMLVDLTDAVANADGAAIAKNAHRINSHATLIGADALRVAADAWETAMRDPDGTVTAKDHAEMLAVLQSEAAQAGQVLMELVELMERAR